MFKKIPGNHNYRISLNCEVIDNDGLECTPTIINNFIEMELYGINKKVDLTWLSLIAHFEIELPLELSNYLYDIVFEDIDVRIKKNAKSISRKITVFKRPIVFNKFFRIIPNFTKYAITASGVLLEIATGNFIQHKVYKIGDYPVVQIYDPDKCCNRQIALHRLVSLAWVNNKDRFYNTIVNHKDGNKLNFYKSNLEWVNYTRNNNHAVENGLRSDTLSCKIRDVITKEVITFPSMKKACEYMGINKDCKFNNLIYKRKGKLIANRYELKESCDDSPWFYDNQDILVCPGRYNLIVTYPNKTTKIFYDVRSLIKELDLINAYGKNVHKVINNAKIKYPGMDIVLIENFTIKPIQAYNVRTGLIIEAPSIRAMTKIIDRDYNSIRTSLNSGETRVSNGFAYRYKIDKPWNKEFTYFACNPMCISATNKLTKHELNFKSLREAANHFKIDRSVIQRCLKNNDMYGNWLFKEI